MQLHFKGLKPKREKTKRERALVLVERDLNIIEYILEMKFSSLQDVFEKFFKINMSGANARSNEAAIRRLQRLVKAGYLASVHSHYESKKYYLGTWKGYYAVTRIKLPDNPTCRPSKAIDHSTFEHDKKVLEARIVLENRKAASCWISDKKLRSNKELAGGLLNSNVPDGIYINDDGKRIAFELEMKTKAKAVYAEKIRKYVLLMRSLDTKVKVFDQVLYVVGPESAKAHLLKETRIYGDLFKVMSFPEFFDHKVSEEQPR